MALTAGALSKTLVGSTIATLTAAAATGGTGPYTYQWYMSQTAAFVPSASTLVTGATSLVQNFTGLLPGTTLYFNVISTDTGNGNATVTGTDMTVITEPSLLPNSFSQNTIVGVVDLSVGPSNVVAAVVDATIPSTTPLYAGQAVKLVTNTVGGIPHVIPITSKSDSVWGFVKFTVKDIQYTAGMNLEVCRWGTVVWLMATGAITQGAEVCIDPTYIGGVQATGATATYCGMAYDGAAAAGLIRVELVPNVAYATA